MAAPMPMPKEMKVSSEAKSGSNKKRIDASQTTSVQSGTNVFNRYEIINQGGSSGLDANSLMNNKVTADFYRSLMMSSTDTTKAQTQVAVNSNKYLLIGGAVLGVAMVVVLARRR